MNAMAFIRRLKAVGEPPCHSRGIAGDRKCHLIKACAAKRLACDAFVEYVENGPTRARIDECNSYHFAMAMRA